MEIERCLPREYKHYLLMQHNRDLIFRVLDFDWIESGIKFKLIFIEKLVEVSNNK